MVLGLEEGLKVNSLTLRRDGEFWQSIKGEFHCGSAASVVDGRVRIAYSTTTVCEASLDERGFLFDQLALDAWLQARGKIPTELSCELLCVDLAGRFIRKVKRETPTCSVLGVRFQLSPQLPHSDHDALWTPGNFAALTVRLGVCVD